MKKTESIEKDALTEMMSPSVSPSAARNAEVKKSVEMASLDFTPNNRIAGSVIDEEAVAEPQSIMEVSTITEEPPTIQRRVSSKQRKLSLEEYRNTYLKVPVIKDRKPVFVSCEVRDRLEDYVRKLGGRKMSVSGLLENIARQHLDTYDADFEQWRKL
jgi:NDP-sugar pyrophosphorylase family protein